MLLYLPLPIYLARSQTYRGFTRKARNTFTTTVTVEDRDNSTILLKVSTTRTARTTLGEGDTDIGESSNIPNLQPITIGELRAIIK